jgi:hypothetical protein
MTFDEVIESINDAMSGLDGETIAKIHNDICITQIEYEEDDQWNKIENDECEVDANGCLINNDGDAETDME